MTNSEIAHIFFEMARMLELKDENPFKIRAYDKAARTILTLTGELAELDARGELESLDGIGKELAEKIRIMLRGDLPPAYRDLQIAVPPGLLKMLDIPGLGPKTVGRIYRQLHISDIDTLEKTARRGGLREVPGITEKVERTILDGIEIVKYGDANKPMDLALETADSFVACLSAMPGVVQVQAAGAVRRRCDRVSEIDIVVAAEETGPVTSMFATAPGIEEVVCGRADVHLTAVTRNRFTLNLRVATPDSFGAALLYHTGSAGFIADLSDCAASRGLVLTPSGLFDAATGSRVAGAGEEEIFDALGLPWIPPVLREQRGEIELARAGTLPRLVELDDIRGDLHIHSTYSDGANSIVLLAERARSQGYRYCGITDHSQSLKVAKGLTIAVLREKIKKIRKLNRSYRDFTVLCGAEVDILPDGSLDYPDEVLAELDYVIASVHTSLKMSRDDMTRRILRAVSGGRVHILGHPTGRLFGARDSYDVDLDAIMSACARHRVAMEVNSYTNRLDLNDMNVLKARRHGVMLSINTDAHYVDILESMKFGVWTAQRGHAGPAEVINCMDLADLVAWLRER